MGKKLCLAFCMAGCIAGGRYIVADQALYQCERCLPALVVAPEYLGPGTVEGDAWTLLSDDLHMVVGIVRVKAGVIMVDRFPRRRVVHGYPKSLRHAGDSLVITMPNDEPVIIDKEEVRQGAFVF